MQYYFTSSKISSRLKDEDKDLNRSKSAFAKTPAVTIINPEYDKGSIFSYGTDFCKFAFV